MRLHYCKLKEMKLGLGGGWEPSIDCQDWIQIQLHSPNRNSLGGGPGTTITTQLPTFHFPPVACVDLPFEFPRCLICVFAQ